MVIIDSADVFYPRATNMQGVGASIWNSMFIGRGDELAQLQRMFQVVLAGDSRATVIGGEAGVGKSRLVRQFLEIEQSREDTSLIVLSAGCRDSGDSPLPFAPIIEALRPLAGQLEEGMRTQLLDPVRDELASVLPDLERFSLPPNGGSAGAMDQRGSGGSRPQLFEKTLALLEGVSTLQPVILVIDDLHWADRSTRDFLSFLIPNLTKSRISLILTYRTDELVQGHPFLAYVAQLQRNRGVDRMYLRRFDRAELAAHLDDIANASLTEDLLQAIWERSQGNAFYAEELFTSTQGEEGKSPFATLPVELTDILLGHLRILSPAAQKLVRLASVGGVTVDSTLLRAVAENFTNTEFDDALREVVQHRILLTEVGSDRLTFRHALLCDVAYADLLPNERRSAHALYGKHLASIPSVLFAEQNASDATYAATSNRIAQLARHYFEAEDFPAALAASLEAAESAWQASGYAESHIHYERVLEIWERVEAIDLPKDLERVDVFERAALASHLEGDDHRSAELIRDALAEVDPGNKRIRLLQVRLGRYLAETGESEAALATHEQAALESAQDPPSEDRAEILCAYAQSLMTAAHHRESVANATDALAIARQIGDRSHEVRALRTLGSNLVVLGDPETGAAHLFEALALAEDLGEPTELASGYHHLAVMLSGPLNRLDDALDVATRGLQRVQELGLERHWGTTLRSIVADTMFRMGRWDEAEQVLSEAMYRSAKGVAALDLYLARAKISVGRGQFELAQSDLDAVRTLSARAIDLRYRIPLDTLLAGLALWQDDVKGARAAVDDGLNRASETDDVWFLAPLVWHGMRVEAEQAESARSLFKAPEVDRAIKRGEELRQLAKEMGESGLQQGALRLVVDAYDGMCDGELQRIKGEPSAEIWENVAASWNQLQQPYPTAYALWRQAESLLFQPQGSRKAAIALREAHAIASRLQAEPLQKHLEALADRGHVDLVVDDLKPENANKGEAVSSLAKLATDANLTKREVQVLELIAKGDTNREIAKTFFISEKTASVHVSNILMKLGVRSRVQAAALIHRLSQ